MGSLDLPSMLEAHGLYRADGKRPDSVTMIFWEMGKKLVRDITVVGQGHFVSLKLYQGVVVVLTVIRDCSRAKQFFLLKYPM